MAADWEELANQMDTQFFASDMVTLFGILLRALCGGKALSRLGMFDQMVLNNWSAFAYIQ